MEITIKGTAEEIAALARTMMQERQKQETTKEDAHIMSADYKRPASERLTGLNGVGLPPCPAPAHLADEGYISLTVDQGINVKGE